MAKQSGAVNLSGKLGDLVFTDGKHGKHVRTSPTLTEEQRKAKAGLPQNKKTVLRNPIASTLNKAVKIYAGALKKGNFYSTVHSKISSAKSNERTLMLRRLYDMDICKIYPFESACPCPGIEVKVNDKNYVVEAEIFIPSKEYAGGNSFSMEFILFVFMKGADECRHDARYSSWIRLTETKPKFVTVEFPRMEEDTDYLLACRANFSVNCKDENLWSNAVMKFVTGNAVTEEGLKLIAEAQKVPEQPRKVERAEKVRVEVRDER